jgi:hypothetical protein
MRAVVLAAAIAVTLVALAVPPAAGDDPKPCHRTSFQVDLVKKACASGGQQAAKNAMKAWVKKAKAAPGGDPDLTCDSCHGDLAPEYPLSDGALAKFKKLNALIK